MQGRINTRIRAMLVALVVTAVGAAPSASAGDLSAPASAAAKKKCGKKKKGKRKRRCGKALPQPLPDIRLSPQFFSFGKVGLGSSPEHNFTVRNYGFGTAAKPAVKIEDKSTLNGGPTPSPAMTISKNGCAADIPTDGACSITVKFNPFFPGVQGAAILTVAVPLNPGGSLSAAIYGSS